MNEHAFDWVRWQARAYGPFRRVLELGSRTMGLPARDAFVEAGANRFEQYLGVDLYPGEGVDIVEDVYTWQVDKAIADAVVCCEVLQHVKDPCSFVMRAAELLKPGGFFIYTAAGTGKPPTSMIDGGPLRKGEHYRNVGVTEMYDHLRAAGFVGCVVDFDAGRSEIWGCARREGPAS